MHSNMHSSNKQRSNHPTFKYVFSLRKKLHFMHSHMHPSSLGTQSFMHYSSLKTQSFIHHSKRETQSFHSFKHTFTQKEKLKVSIRSK